MKPMEFLMDNPILTMIALEKKSVIPFDSLGRLAILCGLFCKYA